MSETSNTMPLKMNQPFRIITDIWGVITSWNFKNELIHYLDKNSFSYLSKYWSEDFIIKFAKNLTEETLRERSTDRGKDMPLIVCMNEVNDREAVIHSIIDNIKWRNDNQYKRCDILDRFEYSVWCEGYEDGSLKPDAFDDVMPAFQRWSSDPLYIKIYSFASGSTESQKLFLSSTKCGNIADYITCGIDSCNIYKCEEKYKAVLNLLFVKKAKDLLYLTNSLRKAKIAKKSGLRVVIVLRPENTIYTEQELKDFNTISSLNDLHFERAHGYDCC